MEITKDTSLDEILKSSDISDELYFLESLTNNEIEARMSTLSSHIRGGALSSSMLLDGEPVFYEQAGQIFSDYLILSSRISSFVARVKSASVEKEIEELKKLKNLLLRDNDSWQLLKESYQKEYNDSTSNSYSTNTIAGGGLSTVTNYEDYYGSNGKITRVNNHIDANNLKIDKINIRLSNLGVSIGTSASSSSTSGTGGNHISSGGGTHGGGGTELGSVSSSGGTYSGGSSKFGSESSSEGTYSGGSSKFGNESLPTQPSEDYVYGEHGRSSSSNSNTSSTKNSGTGTSSTSSSSNSSKTSSSSSSNNVSSSYTLPTIPVSTSSNDLPGKYIGPASDDDSYIEVGSKEYYEWLKKVNIYDKYNIDPDNYDPNGF